MNYEEFKKEVVNNINGYLPEKFKGCELVLTKQNKVNIQKDAIILKMSLAGPAIYLDDLYEVYKSNYSFEDVAKVIYSTLDSLSDNMLSCQISINNLDRGKIVFILINTEKNEKLLAEVPHRSVADLSVIYRYVVESNDSLTSSFNVTNEIADDLGVSEEELYNLAYENTRRLFPLSLRTLSEVIQNILPFNAPVENFAHAPGVFVLSNSNGTYGATAVLYPEILELAVGYLGEHFFILPSSIHEVLLVSCNVLDSIEGLKNMVLEVNRDTLRPCDFLSNNIYVFDRNLKSIVVTNS